MGDSSRQVTLAFQRLRQFCEELGLLLQTAENLFKKENWSSAQTRPRCTDIRGAINVPGKWLPRECFRFYRNDDQKNVLAFISVPLDLPDLPDFDQALVTAGALIYPREHSVGFAKGKTFLHSRLHLHNPNRRDDGSICVSKAPFHWNDSPARAKTIITLGRPLEDIVTAEQLSSKIISSLFLALKSNPS